MILLELEPDWWIRLDLVANIHVKRESVSEHATAYSVGFLLAGLPGIFDWSCKDEAEARERVAYLVSQLWNHADAEGCVTVDKPVEGAWRRSRVRA